MKKRIIKRKGTCFDMTRTTRIFVPVYVPSEDKDKDNSNTFAFVFGVMFAVVLFWILEGILSGKIF